MSSSIFRKTSLDRVNSPEQLDEYVRAASPSGWLVGGSVFLLIAGCLLWMLLGT